LHALAANLVLISKGGLVIASLGAVWICRVGAVHGRGIAAGAWWTREVAGETPIASSNPLMPAEPWTVKVMARREDFSSPRKPNMGGGIPSSLHEIRCLPALHADIYKQWDSSMHHFSSSTISWYARAS